MRREIIAKREEKVWDDIVMKLLNFSIFECVRTYVVFS